MDMEEMKRRAAALYKGMVRTQWFDGDTDKRSGDLPVHKGWYEVCSPDIGAIDPAGSKRVYYRYWNGADWYWTEGKANSLSIKANWRWRGLAMNPALTAA